MQAKSMCLCVFIVVILSAFGPERGPPHPQSHRTEGPIGTTEPFAQTHGVPVGSGHRSHGGLAHRLAQWPLAHHGPFAPRSSVPERSERSEAKRSSGATPGRSEEEEVSNWKDSGLKRRWHKGTQVSMVQNGSYRPSSKVMYAGGASAIYSETTCQSLFFFLGA